VSQGTDVLERFGVFMTESKAKRYDGKKLVFSCHSDAKLLLEVMELFREDIERGMTGLRDAVDCYDHSDHSHPYDSGRSIAHSLRGLFWNCGFTRAGELASFIYETDWKDEAVIFAMIDLEVEAEAAKLIADKIIRAKLPIDADID